MKYCNFFFLKKIEMIYFLGLYIVSPWNVIFTQALPFDQCMPWRIILAYVRRLPPWDNHSSTMLVFSFLWFSFSLILLDFFFKKKEIMIFELPFVCVFFFFFNDFSFIFAWILSIICKHFALWYSISCHWDSYFSFLFVFCVSNFWEISFLVIV